MTALIIVKGRLRSKRVLTKIVSRYNGIAVTRREKQTTTFAFSDLGTAIDASLQIRKKHATCRVASVAHVSAVQSRPRVRKALLARATPTFQKMTDGWTGAVIASSSYAKVDGMVTEPVSTTGKNDDWIVVRPALPLAWGKKVRFLQNRGLVRNDVPQPATCKLASEFLGYTLLGKTASENLPAEARKAREIALAGITIPLPNILGVGFGYPINSKRGEQPSIIFLTSEAEGTHGTVRVDPLGEFTWFSQSLSGINPIEDWPQKQIGSGSPSHPAVAVEPSVGRYGTVGGFVKRSGVGGAFGMTCAHVVETATTVKFSTKFPANYDVTLAIHPHMNPSNAVDVAVIGPISIARHGEIPKAVASWGDDVALGTNFFVYGAKSGLRTSTVRQVLKSPLDLSTVYKSLIPLYFSGILFCDPCTQKGDSGAVAITANDEAVGLVIAGCSQYSLVQSFSTVATAVSAQRYL